MTRCAILAVWFVNLGIAIASEATPLFAQGQEIVNDDAPCNECRFSGAAACWQGYKHKFYENGDPDFFYHGDHFETEYGGTCIIHSGEGCETDAALVDAAILEIAAAWRGGSTDFGRTIDKYAAIVEYDYKLRLLRVRNCRQVVASFRLTKDQVSHFEQGSASSMRRLNVPLRGRFGPVAM